VIDLATLRLLSPETRGMLGKSTSSKADKEVVTFKGPALSVDFSPEDSWLCVGASDNKVTLWRVSDGECYQTFDGHADSITSVRFSPDGMMILSASYDGTAKIWRVSDGHLAMSLEEHTSFISGAEWGEKGQLVATGSGDHLVLIWDPEEGRVLHRLEGHESWVLAVAFAPRDHILASCGADNLVFLWDALTGSKLSMIDEHTDWVESVCFDPTGIMLASAGHDRDIRVWDVTEPTAPRIRLTLKGRRPWPVMSWLYYKATDLGDWLRGKEPYDDEIEFGVLDAVTNNTAQEDPKLNEIGSRYEGHLAERAMALVRDDVLGLNVRDQVRDAAQLGAPALRRRSPLPRRALSARHATVLCAANRASAPAARHARRWRSRRSSSSLRARTARCPRTHLQTRASRIRRCGALAASRLAHALPQWTGLARLLARVRLFHPVPLHPPATAAIRLPYPCVRAQLKLLLEQQDEEHRTVEHKLRERPPFVTWEELLECFELAQVFEGHSDSFSDGFRISVLGF
jgi:hypothetical protein